MNSPTYKEWYRQTLDRLNGTKHLILGNHDKLDPFMYLEVGITTVHTHLEYRDYMLTHDPAYATVLPDKIWLCGHIHKLFSECGNCINVGVDVRDFKPISITEIDIIANRLRKDYANKTIN